MTHESFGSSFGSSSTSGGNALWGWRHVPSGASIEDQTSSTGGTRTPSKSKELTLTGTGAPTPSLRRPFHPLQPPLDRIWFLHPGRTLRPHPTRHSSIIRHKLDEEAVQLKVDCPSESDFAVTRGSICCGSMGLKAPQVCPSLHTSTARFPGLNHNDQPAGQHTNA